MTRHLVRTAVALAGSSAAYMRFVRPWHQQWGATTDESAQPLPGDDEVPVASYRATRAITIDAPADVVWPWIAQIGYVGYGRGGWYAFDFFDADSGRRHSTWRLVPEAQQLSIGLQVGEEGFRVTAFEPERLLVLAWHYDHVEWVRKDGVWPKFGECSMAFVLRPLANTQTRLVVRTRLNYATPGIHSLWWPLFDLGDFLQQWKMLPGIKHRAEAAASYRTWRGGGETATNEVSWSPPIVERASDG